VAVIKKARDFKHFSPSQLGTHIRCRRKWWLQKISNLPSKHTTKAMMKGTGVHSTLEHRLLTATWKELADIKGVASGKLLLRIAQSHGDTLFPSEPVPKDLVEHKIKTKSITGRVCKGVVDWVEPENNRINDHKTLSSSAWVKMEVELKSDFQAICYCKDALDNMGFTDLVKFRHIYYPTTSKAQPDTTEIVMSANEIQTKFNEKVEPRVAIMTEDAEIELPGEVVPNPSACGDYGGCEFRDLCGQIGDLRKHRADPFESLPSNKDKEAEQAETGVKKMGLFNRVKKTQAKKAEEVKEDTKTAGINPPDGVARDKKTSLGKEKVAKPAKKAKKAETAATVETNEPTPKPEQIEAMKKLAASLAQKSVEKAKATKAAKSKPDKGQEPKGVTMKEALGIEGAGNIKPADPKDKDNPLGTMTIGQGMANESEPENTTKPAKKAKASKPVKDTSERTLYVDCHPRGVDVKYFDTWVAPLVSKVELALGTKHYALAPWDYGRGKGEIESALKTNIEVRPKILPRHLIISKGHPLFSTLFPELARHYHVIESTN
jgi:hypothetical protein